MTKYTEIILTLGLIFLGLLISLIKVELLIRGEQVKHIKRLPKNNTKNSDRMINFYKKSKRARKLRYLYLRYLR
ncbi:MAG: hypothetical protein QXL78_06160 [Methanocellales archaeon]